MVKIKQRVLENTGIKWHGKTTADGGDAEPTDGYQHHDAMWFPSSLGGHVAYKEQYHLSQENFAKYINNNVIKPNKIKSVLELGCGAGSLAYFLRKENSELLVVTLDGNRESYEKSPFIDRENHFVVKTDEDYELVDELGNVVVFDLILSFEHFEHINPEKLSNFFKNIKKHIHKDTLILASAATYDGGHPNLHPSIFSKFKWTEVLNENGFSVIDTEHLKYAPLPFNIQMNLTNELFFRLNTNQRDA